MTLKPRKIVFWLLALLALAVLAWLGLREPEQMVSAAAVTRGPLEVSFVEEGKTRLKQRYVVTAPVAGTLRRVTLQPGDAAVAGSGVVGHDGQVSPAEVAHAVDQHFRYTGLAEAADEERRALESSRPRNS